jgi:UDP-N-acetylglucosamine 2-epimerase (non-hydrolysing)
MAKPVVLVVFGTRPEVIKLAPVVHALKAAGGLTTRTCVTAQHRQMLDLMLGNFQLTPDFDLDLMQRDQDLTGFSSRALPRLQTVLRRVRPDCVLVQGDTTTAFITALAAFYEKIPVGHVEAGLRSFDRENPYPEETNRVLISRLCDMHFTPTRAASENLLKEGVPARAITLTGNTVVDALRWGCSRAHRVREPALAAGLKAMGPGDKAVLVTTHRRENHGKPLEALCGAFLSLLHMHPGLHLFYPVHMNPKVLRTVRRVVRHPRAHLLPALEYFDLLHLMRRSHFVLTDSGGLQEEAPALGKPVIILRKVTERPEGVLAGVAALAGTDPRTVVRVASRLVDDGAFYDTMAKGGGIYGDGRASLRIVDQLRHRFGLVSRRPRDYRP